MTVVVGLGLLTGIGCLGIAYGLRSATPSLDVVLTTWQRGPDGPLRTPATGTIARRLGAETTAWAESSGWYGHPRAVPLRTALAITDMAPDLLATRILVLGAAALLLPPLLWLGCQAGGLSLPLLVPLLLIALSVALAIGLPVFALFRVANERRRHFRVVVGSFVDLVVLGLAGGVGVEGALHAATQVSPDWAAQRMARVLLTARDGGMSPWTALAGLGVELDVQELVELSAIVQLAGTEGARIRQTLSARAASLRRHEQAEAESAANAVTERLFLPGALLLLGFLLFIGYPAVERILGGF